MRLNNPKWRAASVVEWTQRASLSRQRLLDTFLLRVQTRSASKLVEERQTNDAASAARASSSRPAKEPVDYSLSARLAVMRQRERVDHENDLAFYSYKTPAGKIPIMKKSLREMQDEVKRLLSTSPLDVSSGKQRGKNRSVLVRISEYHKPKVHFCQTVERADKMLSGIQSGEVLSLDMEWENNAETLKASRTSLVQIATATDVFMIQLSVMQTLPKELARILANPLIIKCGVAINDDMRKLRKDFDHESLGALELSRVAKLADPRRWENEGRILISLRDLCRIYLNRTLRKDIALRSGKWNNVHLDEMQIDYAASDAYVGIEILYALAHLVVRNRSLANDQNLFKLPEVQELINRASMKSKMPFTVPHEAPRLTKSDEENHMAQLSALFNVTQGRSTRRSKITRLLLSREQNDESKSVMGSFNHALGRLFPSWFASNRKNPLLQSIVALDGNQVLLDNGEVIVIDGVDDKKCTSPAALNAGLDGGKAMRLSRKERQDLFWRTLRNRWLNGAALTELTRKIDQKGALRTSTRTKYASKIVSFLRSDDFIPITDDIKARINEQLMFPRVITDHFNFFKQHNLLPAWFSVERYRKKKRQRSADTSSRLGRVLSPKHK